MKILKNKKGFTLIEIVVVVVIIAILAAILVPSMLAWIDSAKERTVLSAADTIRQTVSAEVLEIYKDGVDVDGTPQNNTTAYGNDFLNAVRNKTGTSIQMTNSSADKYLTFTVDGGDVTYLSYTEGNLTAVYENDSWTCTKN